MAEVCRTQNAKTAKALLFPKANGFLRSSRLRPFITCTHIVFQTIHSTRQNKVIRNRTAITVRLFTSGFKNKV